MVSIVRLRFNGGGAATVTEGVPFVAFGQDKGNPGAGEDFFSLTVVFATLSIVTESILWLAMYICNVVPSARTA
jgi:hypothetical protein